MQINVIHFHSPSSNFLFQFIKTYTNRVDTIDVSLQMSIEMRKVLQRETLSSFDIWFAQLPLPLSLPLYLPLFTFSLVRVRVISRSRSRPRDSHPSVRRTSISVAASRGFREPRPEIPLPPRRLELRTSPAEGILRRSSGDRREK